MIQQEVIHSLHILLLFFKVGPHQICSVSVFLIYLSRIMYRRYYFVLDETTSFKLHIKLTSFFGKLAKGLMMDARGTWHCLARSAVQGRE